VRETAAVQVVKTRGSGRRNGFADSGNGFLGVSDPVRPTSSGSACPRLVPPLSEGIPPPRPGRWALGRDLRVQLELVFASEDHDPQLFRDPSALNRVQVITYDQLFDEAGRSLAFDGT
jgi:hypothetical protein